jgi:sodium/potassium-transporting ATPase subunit alpha
MHRPPRHPKEDRLLSGKALAVAYGQIGIIQTFAGHFTYYVIMAESGFFPGRMFGLRSDWESGINDLEDSYGQEWVSYCSGIVLVTNQNQASCSCDLDDDAGV